MQNHPQKIKFILLPGLHGTGALFRNFITHCPESFETMAFSFPVQQKLSYQELTEWLADRLLSIPGPLVLVGESFSGPLSLFTAGKVAEKILAVVLVASFIEAPRPGILSYLPWEIGFGSTRLLFALRNRLAKFTKRGGIRTEISAELQKVNPGVLAHRIRQTLSVNGAEALKSCPVPVLYLQAAKDRMISKSALKKILSIRPTVQVRTLPTHHFVLQSSPQEAWLAIREFIAGLSPLSPTGHPESRNYTESE